jgi:hypothetical protein
MLSPSQPHLDVHGRRPAPPLPNHGSITAPPHHHLYRHLRLLPCRPEASFGPSDIGTPFQKKGVCHGGEGSPDSVRSKAPSHLTRPPSIVKKIRNTTWAPQPKRCILILHARGVERSSSSSVKTPLSSSLLLLLVRRHHCRPPPPPHDRRQPHRRQPIAPPPQPTIPNHSRCLPPPPTHPSPAPAAPPPPDPIHRAPRRRFLTNPTPAAKPGSTRLLHHPGGRRRRRPPFRPHPGFT